MISPDPLARQFAGEQAHFEGKEQALLPGHGTLDLKLQSFRRRRATDDALYASIIKEMHNEGIEVTNDNIKIIQNNSRGINVQIDYTVKLDLLVYQTNLHFTPEMNSQALVQ